jgi:hypothetical protein
MAVTRSTSYVLVCYELPMACISLTNGGSDELTARIVMKLMVGTVATAYGADRPHFGSQVGPSSDIPLAKAHQTLFKSP